MNHRGRRYRRRSHNRSKDPCRYYYSRTNSSWNNNSRRNCNVNYYRSKDRSKHDYSKRTQYSSYICWIDHSLFWMSSKIWKINVCRYTHWILALIRFRNSKIQDWYKYSIYGLEWFSIFNSWWYYYGINSTDMNIMTKSSNIWIINASI